MNLNEKIVNLAVENGFDWAGIAELKENSSGFEKFRQWIENKYHGEMGYLERGLEKRKTPSLILQNAKTILMLALKDQAELNLSKKSPFISRYAWGEDYHLLIDQKMQQLENQLKEKFPKASFKRYVDTGPIQEKEWAALAGLGWIGKHTNLIHPKNGSYFFLSSLLTDLEVEKNHPISDHCGKCTACIDICPTQAIIAPYVLDARLCISYLTIELKGPIPRYLRPMIGTHLFGCDDCQEVCPWNRRAKIPIPSIQNSEVQELIGFLSFSEDQFKKRFFQTPILRTKRRGFVRNVCVVLGNLKNRLAIPALQNALNDDEPLIRSHAAWGLGQMLDEETRTILKERLRIEEIESVKEEIQEAIDNPIDSGV